MKRLLIVILVAALGWFAYWFIAAQTARSAYESWFDARRAEGWQAHYSALNLRGFPNRIDTTFDALQLADPETGFAWEAPFLQIFALSYRPNHLIAVWPNTQQLATPLQKLDVNSEDMRASFVVQAGTDLAFARANIATDGLAIISDAGWQIKAEALRAALAQDEENETLYHLALQGQGVAPPAFLRNTALPETMSALDLDASLGFDRSWDRRALEERRPQPTQIDLRLLKAQWGGMLIEATGDMITDAQGVLNGELTLRAKEWANLIETAKQSAQLDPMLIDGAEQLLRLMASLSGPGDDIDLTLTFKNGRIWAGLFPLGPAPVLVLR